MSLWPYSYAIEPFFIIGATYGIPISQTTETVRAHMSRLGKLNPVSSACINRLADEYDRKGK